MIIETEGRKRFIYNDAVLVKRKNSKVVIWCPPKKGVVIAKFMRVPIKKVRKKDLSSNQTLIKRVGITVLITEIAFSKESLNDFIIALDAIGEIKNKKLCTEAKQTK